jgi:hypothetical protein
VPLTGLSFGVPVDQFGSSNATTLSGLMIA